MLYPKALPLALPEVHLCVADVFAEIASAEDRVTVCGRSQKIARNKYSCAAAEEKLPIAIGIGKRLAAVGRATSWRRALARQWQKSCRGQALAAMPETDSQRLAKRLAHEMASDGKAMFAIGNGKAL